MNVTPTPTPTCGIEFLGAAHSGWKSANVTEQLHTCDLAPGHVGTTHTCLNEAGNPISATVAVPP